MPPIPEFLGGPNGWMFWTCALILIGGLLWKPVRAAGKRIQQFFRLLDTWSGVEEVRDKSGAVIQVAAPGVLARLISVENSTSKIGGIESGFAELETFTKRIHHEVTPNHGGSIKDAVKRIEERSNEMAYKLAETTDKLDEHIVIAKESDKAQEKLVEDVGKLKSKYAPEE